MENKTTVIGLWAYPRTLSTPVERVFIERTDCTVFHEPFFNAFYYSYQRGSRRNHPDSLSLEKTTQDYDAVIKRVFLPEPTKNFVFFKDMAFYSYPYLIKNCPNFYQKIINTFIIRNPREAIISHYKISPDLQDYPEEVGIRQQYLLFEYVTQKLQQPAIVIEADALSFNSEAILQQYCSLTGIPYDSKALKWQADKIIPAWEEWREWHIDTIKSCSIYPIEAEILHTPLPTQLEALIAELKPYYDQMLNYAIGK